MLFSIPLLVLAAGVLASPRETAKRGDEASPDYGYDYGYDYDHAFDFLTESSVEPTTYRRHRHTPKNGSPGPPVLISAKPTSTSAELVEILDVTTTLESFLDASTSEVKTSTFTTTSVVTLTPAEIITSEVSSASPVLTTSIASTPAVSTPELSPITATSSSIPLSSSSALASITQTTSSTLFPSSSGSTSATSPAVTSTIATATATSSKTALSDLGVQPPTTFVSDLDPASPTFKALVLQHHNIHRHNHSAPDLTWDNKLAEYAETTAKTCVWGHNVTPGGGYYGQNIAAGIQSGNITAILSNNFYNDEQPKYPEYGISSPDLTLFEEWGHFSQLVWKNTLSVGCYTEICSPPGANALDCKPDKTSYLSGLDCGNGGVPAIFTVCNYDPPGNVAGGYLNVNPPQDDSSVSVDENGVQGI